MHRDLTQDRLEAVPYNPDGKPHGYFQHSHTALKKQGHNWALHERLALSHDRCAGGVLPENGKEHQKVISSDVPAILVWFAQWLLCLRGWSGE